jgi:CRP/FNR family transcriptional regulator, cyclic AMP receptor protein
METVVDQDVAYAMAGSFLGALPSDVVDELLAGGIRSDYPAGALLYRDRDAPRCVLVVDGLIRVYMTSPEGRQVTVRYARARDVLGVAVIVGGPVDVSVLTLAPSCLFGIDARILVGAARRDARVAWSVAQELGRRLYETLQQTAINAFGTVKQRVASHLLDLASSQPQPRTPLVATVSQQELADAAGSVREVVARVLRELRVAGVVATGPDSVVILDPARLHDEAWPATAR